MKILFLGDSITDCGHCFTEDGLGYGYVKLIYEMFQSKAAETPPPEIVNGGTDGFTFPRVYKKYKQFYLEESFDTVVITCGINDTSALEETGLSENQKDRFLEYCMFALKELIHLLKENGVKRIILIEPFVFPRPAWSIKWMRSLGRVREGIEKMTAEDAKLILLKVQSDLDCVMRERGIEEITPDGIHLTADGQKILAEKVYKVLSDRS